MPDVGLDTTRRIEVPPAAGVLWLLVPGVAVGVCIDRCIVVDGVDVKPESIAARREVFSNDDRVEFWTLIPECTELPSWADSRLPTGTERRP